MRKIPNYCIPVTRIFCSECGSAISHKSVVFGEAQAVQTGNFVDFAKIPIKTERKFFINSGASKPRHSCACYSLREGPLDWLGTYR